MRIHTIPEIEEVIDGKMEMCIFMKKLHGDVGLQEAVKCLIPAEARMSRSHVFWKGLVVFQNLKDVTVVQILDEAYRHSFGNRFGGDLNGFSALSRMYCFWFPKIIPTDKYSKRFNLYLEAVGDSFEGPEVTETLCTIIEEALKERTKAARKAKAKALISEQFHLDDRKRPFWIQGGEWPMGVHSPMKYISKCRKGEKVIFTFQDVDTLEKRDIIQYY